MLDTTTGRMLLGTLAAMLCGTLAAEDWPQFRGPNCTGISTGTQALPAEFSPDKNVAWVKEVGDGIGCPVVASGRAFVSGMTEAQELALFAFDLKTGERLWRKSWPTPDLDEVHKTNSHASTTPCADAERVYFYFKSLGMVALDARTGEVAWRKELPQPFFVFKWGAGMSPILYENLVIFCQDDDLNPALYAFDKATGEIVWKEERHDQSVNYSHPVIARTAQGDELIVAGTGKLIGYDLKTGERLWTADTLLRNIKTTPVVVGETIYISLQSAGIANQWLASVDRAETGNNDGKLTREEVQAFAGKMIVPEAFFQRTFDRGDLNKDGFLQGEELDLAFLPEGNHAGAKHTALDPAEEFILAVKAGGRGDVTKSHVLWKRKTRYTDHIVSPFVSDGRMLLVKCGGISTLFDLDGGKPLRGPKRIPGTCNYFASPVCGDGKIYVAGENGTVSVLANTPGCDVLATNDLGEAIIATPAIADGRLLIRTRTKLYCIAEK